MARVATPFSNTIPDERVHGLPGGLWRQASCSAGCVPFLLVSRVDVRLDQGAEMRRYQAMSDAELRRLIAGEALALEP